MIDCIADSVWLVAIAQLQSNDAEQRQEIKALAATLKEQASQIQKVSAQLELSKSTPQAALNNR